MAEASWPFYGVETNETQFSKWARALADSGIVSGLALTPGGSGMTVSAAAGIALVRGVYYELDAPKTLTFGAAPGSGTRLDAVILKLDQTANTITLEVKAGGTSLPALTQNETTYELLVGQVAIPAGAAAITSGMITQFFPSPGLRVIPYASDARRPANPGIPVAIGVQTAAKRLDLWVDGAWVSLSDLGNMSGVLPLSKGGTGATTRVAALNALGIFPQADAPAHSPGRIWIKTG